MRMPGSGPAPVGQQGPTVAAASVDGWLTELGLEPVERAEREGIASWDLVLDGRARRDIRVTLILEPRLALLAWAQFAPPLNDSFRVSFRQFLRWSDEIPFVKFALAEDERPVLASEVPVAWLDRDVLGETLVRLLLVCDLLLTDSVRWLWPGRKAPPAPGHPARHLALIDRYASRLADLDAAVRERHTPTSEPGEEASVEPS